MSEWFYIKTWKAAYDKAWTLVDGNYNLYLPEGVFLTKFKVEEVMKPLQQKKSNNKVYRIIHKDSMDYKSFLETKRKKEYYANNIT